MPYPKGWGSPVGPFYDLSEAALSTAHSHFLRKEEVGWEKYPHAGMGLGLFLSGWSFPITHLACLPPHQGAFLGHHEPQRQPDLGSCFCSN